MHGRSIVGLLLAILVVSATAGIGVAQTETIWVRGHPELDVFVPNSTVTPGQSNEVVLQIANDGELRDGVNEHRTMVTTARNVRIDVESNDPPITVETNQQSVGTIDDGTVHEVPVMITVPVDVDPGEYSLDAELKYSYTSQYFSDSWDANDRTRTVTRTIDIRVADHPRFILQADDTAVQVGGSGPVTVAVTNTGEEPAEMIDVSLTSENPSITFGANQRATARIDRLASGGTTMIDYEVSVTDDAISRHYSLDGTIQYTDTNGIQRTANGLSLGFKPINEQTFDIGVEASTLRVGETGTISGTITNTGPIAVNDLVLVLNGRSSGVPNATYAVGELGRNESTVYRFQTTVPPNIDSAPQQLDVVTRYQTPTGNHGSTTDTIRVPLDEQTFDLTIESSTLRVGETGTISGTITNTGPIAVEEAVVVLDGRSIAASNKTYAVGELDHNESAAFNFQTTIPRGIDAGPHQIDVLTQYRTAAGNQRTTANAIRLEVADYRDAVRVSGVSARFAAGESGTLELQVTNQRDGRIRDVIVQLAVTEPLESDFRSVIVSSLAPGETALVAFDLAIDDDARLTQYPAFVSVNYTAPDNKRVAVQSQTIAVQVMGVDGSGVAAEQIIFGILFGLVIVGAWWYYRN